VTAGVRQVHDDFLAAVQRVREVPYDLMEVQATQFQVISVTFFEKSSHEFDCCGDLFAVS